MAAVAEALAARDGMDEESRIKLSAASIGDRESELSQWTLARASADRMRTAADRAIRLSQEAYRLSPPTPDDPRAQKPTSLDGGWCAGLSAPWAPGFRIPGYRSIVGTDGAAHYISDAPDGKTAGITDPDGRVAIFPFAFEWARRIGDPGPLALSIHHESIHYEDLITTGWDTHERMEIRALRKSMEQVDSLLPMGTMNGMSIRGLFKRSFQRMIDANKKNHRFGSGTLPLSKRGAGGREQSRSRAAGIRRGRLSRPTSVR